MLDNCYSYSRDIPFILPYNETSLRQLVASGLNIRSDITTIQFLDNISNPNRRTTVSSKYFRNCLTDIFSYHANTSSSCPRQHSQHNHSARTKKSGVPSTFLNLWRHGQLPLRAKKERTSSQISNEARPSAFGEIWKRRVKWGHTISPIHFTQPSTQLLV